MINTCLYIFQTKVVYGHYGRYEDYKELEARSVPVKDSLLILRYGRLLPANKVRFKGAVSFEHGCCNQ